MRTGKSLKLALVLLVVLLCSLLTPGRRSPGVLAAQAEEPPIDKIRLGVVTGSNPVRIIKQWRFLSDYITKATGLPVEFVLRENYLDLLPAMKNKEVDLCEGGAFLYVQMHDEAGARILVGEDRKGSLNYYSVIIVRADSGINNLDDLKGKTFAFTDPDSASGYLYPRIMLADAGITDPQNFFSSTYFSKHHDTAIKAVINGTVDAAGVGLFFLDDLSAADRKKIKIIAMSEPIPSGPISYRPGFPQDLVEKLRNALYVMHKSMTPEQIREMTVDRWVPATDEIYKTLRQRVEQLKQLPPVTDSIKYRTAPQEFNQYIDKTLNKWQIIISLPICLLIVSLVASFIFLRRKTAHSLKAKMIFAFISTGVVILTIFSASTILDLRTKVRKAANEFLWDLKSFEAGCASAVSDDQLALLPVYTDEFAHRQSIIYSRIIHNGMYVADSMHRDTGKGIADNILNDKFYLAGTFPQPMIEIVDPIVVSNKIWGMVQTGYSSAQIRSLVVRTFAANVIVILVSMTLSIALAYFLANHITRPLALLMSSIESMGRGKTQPIDIKSKDDIGQLGRAFEQMRTNLKVKEELLQSKMEELDTAQAQLQQIHLEREQIESHVRELEDKLAEIDDRITSEESTAAVEQLEKSKRDIEVEYGIKKQQLKEMDSLVPPSQTELNGLRDKMASIEKTNPELAELRRTIIIGQSPAFTRAVRDIYMRSRDSDPVLIYGESGSGKTGTAHAIHKLSDRADRPFGEFNCAEFASADPMIVLGKLFGYGKDCGIQGIPREGQPGLLQKFDGGTLFLDEVTSLPLHAQALLLLPLEGRPFNPAAGHGPAATVSVRFIFASNTPLLQEVEKGTFRKDLIRRMRMRGVINIPPLRERKEDIPLLARRFLDRWTDETNCRMEIAPGCMEVLKNWDYRTFNVGELYSTIRVAADQAYFDGKLSIEIAHLPAEMHSKVDLDISGLSGIADEPTWADETERRELMTLRKNRFLITLTETALGYPKNSKTLTNHFRGLCYKTLGRCDWQIKPAVAILTGRDSSQEVVNRVWRKVEQYLQGLEEAIQLNEERKLLNNLPQKYHHCLEEAVKRYRKA